MPSHSASSVPLSRKLYELAQAQAGGTVRLSRPDGATAPLDLEILRGWVHAVDLSPAYGKVGDAPPRGEDKLRILLKLSLEEYSLHSHDPEAKPRKRGACSPFHPAATLRNHIDGLARAGGEAGSWRLRLGDGRVQIPVPPHASCLGQDERPVVGFLNRPRTVAELEAARLCPPDRADRLLAFLDAVGALQLSWAPGTSPYATLELPDYAPVEEVKRAFKRLARELHPDRHSTASTEEQRVLERRFAEVSAAYRRLV